MTIRYYIKELTNNEIKSLLSDKKFSCLHPVKCNQCGNTTDFQQKLYRIDTIPKKIAIDKDERQNFLCYHMKKNYNYDSIFFKIND